MLHVLARAFADDGFEGLRFEGSQGLNAGGDEFEKVGVADQGNFDGLDQANPAFADRKPVEEGKVVNDSVGDAESTKPVFLAEEIDPVFHADPAVALAQAGGGHAHEGNAAMGGGGGKAHQIEPRAAADRENVGVATKPGGLDGLPDPF